MDKETNIIGTGKRMPYKIPDGMLDKIERNVLNATGCGRKPSHRLRMVSIAITVAAALILIATFAWHRQPVPMNSLAEVQQAFANLDNADQAFLSEIYNEDTFMNINY